MSDVQPTLTLALIHDVFFDDGGAERLNVSLSAARERGAELAVLPELPLDPWFPVGRERRPENAEKPGGKRHACLSAAARRAGIAVLGGAVVDGESGKRFNRALLYSAGGDLVASYDKVHLPQEEGFWEADQYDRGTASPRRVDALGLPLGLQICSDVNRPMGSHLLGAQGVMVILTPRATEAATFPRWRLVMQANAVTSCAFFVSVNRPRPEPGVALGGPSVVIAPDGEVLVETEDALSIVEIDGEAVARAKSTYPGYMEVFPELYVEGWKAVSG